ncbi:hypothetical protein [Streptomyces diastatochromogenes]|uniref:Uncharacterized protein n=1 Tax=Streptomyces diastatochromogenes TaxID=42236 RepID=A0A233RYA9_STRDA|nr:hypothetical protein [Streptomyces diastatochromogenes]OXY88377.1 hypothetical protein BEK98_42080 [Streptomyces diastatochromogenes]
MSDSSSRAPEAEPDFLDRLIARHTAPAPDTVRVRPRLPGPFERVEAVRAGTPDPDATDSVLWPTATPSPAPDRDAPRPAAEARLHTERERTVVHTERAPAEPAPRPAPTALPEAPLLRPAAPLAPGPLAVPRTGPRTSGRGGPEQDANRAAAPVPIPPGTGAAPPTAVSAAPRPSAADTTAAREAVRQAAARRPGKAPEQVVQVQIGRLEVTAGPSPTRNGPGRPTRSAERPGAALSLADYLARGRE